MNKANRLNRMPYLVRFSDLTGSDHFLFESSPLVMDNHATRKDTHESNRFSVLTRLPR